MKVFLFLAILSAACLAQDANDAKNINPISCGKRTNLRVVRSNKIVGGQQAASEDWTWQVALTNQGKFACGGSLINSQWIVTAAHCISNNGVYSVTLGAGNRINPESWAIRRNVSRVVKHSEYNGATLKNDIALMKLSTAIRYSKQIQPVCVPSSTAESSYAGKTSWATGWGTTSFGGQATDYLMEVTMSVLTDSECKSKYALVDPARQICAGETGTGKDTCQGDSGGPLVIQNGQTKRWELLGITSYGADCGNGGVYTKASWYRAWIQENIQRL